MSGANSEYRIIFDHLPENDYQQPLWRLQKRRWWGWETLAVNNMPRIEALLLQLQKLENEERKETKP